MAGRGAAAAENIDSIPAGSFRADVIDSAKRFEASWLDLARHLVRVRGEGLWQEWGYATFEAYCAKELRIKKATAQKLVMSYGFLEKHEPEALEDEDRARKTPSFEVIEVLSRAEERGQLDDQHQPLAADLHHDRATVLPQRIDRPVEAQRRRPRPRLQVALIRQRLPRIGDQGRELRDHLFAGADRFGVLRPAFDVALIKHEPGGAAFGNDAHE